MKVAAARHITSGAAQLSNPIVGGVCCWEENKTSKKTIVLTNETKKVPSFWLALRATSMKTSFFDGIVQGELMEGTKLQIKGVH